MKEQNNWQIVCIYLDMFTITHQNKRMKRLEIWAYIGL